jgi:thiamine-monophosphate kinase
VALDEFDLIRTYFAPLSAPGAVGLRDDVASVPVPEGREMVVKTDMIAEGVHFLSDDPPDSVARKLLRVNLSDLAAKGCQPFGYVLNAAFPRTVAESWIASFAAGLARDQEEYGCALLGGDTIVHRGAITLGVTFLGTAPAGMPRRGNARIGDKVAMSGVLGEGVLGLALLQNRYAEPDPVRRAALIEKYRVPQPRLRLGQELVRNGLLHATMDISDGLIGDCTHLAQASSCHVRLELEEIPLASADPAWREALLTGGDDYEILMTIPPAHIEVAAKIARACATSLTVIGAIEPGEGVSVRDRSGEALAFTRSGYRHRFG